MKISQHQYSWNLWDRIRTKKNFRKAFSHIRSKGTRSPGADGETPKSWMKFSLNSKLKDARVDIEMTDFAPRMVTPVFLSKGRGKVRKVAILCLKDQVITRAIYQVVSQVFDSRFSNSNFAYRPHRNRNQAAQYCQQLINSGCQFWVKADIKDCFGSIDQRRLNGLIKRVFGTDDLLYSLLIKYVRLGVGNKGIVQGGCLSPFFSNLYLDDVDKNLAKQGYLFAHYADDYVIGCRTRAEADAALEYLTAELRKIRLELNSEKTRILDLRNPQQCLNFCGFKIFHDQFLLSDQSVRRMQTKAKKMIDDYVNIHGGKYLGEFEQEGLDNIESRNRQWEKWKNKLLKRFPSVFVIQDLNVIPKFWQFLLGWIEQHEIVEYEELARAVNPIFEYSKSKQKTADE